MGESVVRTKDPVGEAAARVVAAVHGALLERGFARIAVPGGSASAVLGAARQRLTPDEWSKVRLTWIDERCVNESDDRSNRGAAYRAGFLSSDAPPGIELPLWLDGETPEKAATRVRDGLERHFGNRFDVVVYGLGEDGHIASLFPNHRALSTKGRVAFVSDSPKPPAERMTLTFDVLRTAGRALLVVSGEAKRKALEQTLAGDPYMPANVLPEVMVVTDLDA